MRTPARPLLLCGLIAPPLFAAFVFAATLARADYSSIAITLSHLGDIEARHAWVFNTGIALYGALVAAFAVGTYGTLGASRRALAIAVPLAMYGLANIAIGAFKVDVLENGGGHGLERATHIAAARAAYLLAIAAMLGAACALPGKLRWISLLAAASMVVFGVLFSIESVSEWNGLWQRGFIGTATAWVEALAIAMYRSRQRRRLTDFPARA
jgi:hypothetical membrane protein